MATVYLAEDIKHRRPVAVKAMHEHLAALLGPERFLREIEIAAHLQHPHILPLFDSGESGGLLYYVMPYVEGETLRARLTREGQFSLEDACAIARQVASALFYAHGRGIVHRDIKPENIMLPGGVAVVADFGIAKALAAAGSEALTQTGMIIGTPQYMSPEQAAGERALDGRSDLYALGCVLFEMLAGQPPFTGPTMESVVHQHLSVEPPSVTNLRPTVPAGVAEALRRALAKTPADRFGAVSQFAEALSRAGVGHAAHAPSVDGRVGHRSRLIGAAAVVVIVVIAAVLLMRRAPPAVQLGRQTQVTIDPGLEIDPALSPDGALVAYSGPGGVLMVRQVEGGAPVLVIRGGDGQGRWPAWAPDGQRLIFLSSRGAETVPALGGTPRLVATGAARDRGITIAPDGRSMAFVAHDSLLAAPLDGGPARLITVGREIHSPAWSPDGRWIAFVSGNTQYVRSREDLGNIAPSSIHVVRSSGGRPTRVIDDQALSVSPAWLSGRTLLYVSGRDGGRDVYQIDLKRSGAPADAPRRLTTGLNPHSIAASLDGARLAYSAFTETSNAWSLAVPAEGSVSISQARAVTSGNQTIENMDVSHDGRWLAFSSNRTGTTQLYRVRMDAPGVEPQQLTTDITDSFWSAWSPDAREIAFHRFRGERRQVVVMSAEGGGLVPVTDGSEDERSPEWSPDGRHLVLLANWGTHAALHIVTRGAEGQWSAPRPLPVVLGSDTVAAGLATWSPDGRSLACGCGPGGLVIVPVEGGPARRLPSPFSAAGWAFPQWSADGRTVFHLVEDSARVTAVAAVPLSGGRPRVAVRFDDPLRPWHRFGFRFSGGRMFFTLGDRQSDIWVAEVGGTSK